MKTIQVTILTIAALTLSGCATGYYQRDYVGYGSGNSSPSYYQGYGRSYSSPGTSITYGRYYVQPSYRPGYHHDDHHDWHQPSPHFGGHNGGWGGRDFGHERHTEQMPRHDQPMAERQERGFGRRDNDDHQQRGSWGGRFGGRGD